MAENRIVAEPREERGTRAAKRLRREGMIPAVVYGHGLEAMPVAVEGRALRHALTGGAGLNSLLMLDIGGEEHMALARQIQRDPTRHTVNHLDFIVVNRNEVISSEIPIVLVGEAKDLGSEGVIEQPLTTLTIHSRPGDIPAHLEVDISHMAIGNHVAVRDLKLPEGVTTDVDPSETVVIVRVSAVSLEIEAEEAEAEEAAEAEAAGETEGEHAEGSAEEE